MKSTIPHLRPWIIPDDVDAVNQALIEKSVCHWQYAEKFSHALCIYSGISVCHLFSSGTLALRAALRRLDLHPKSKIGIPSFTCDGVLRAVISAGYKPYIIDCDDSGLMNGEIALDACNRNNIQACIAVHQFGLINNALQPLAEFIPVIEDCSHVPPKRYVKRSVAVCGSLEGTKLIGAGEGGYILHDESEHENNKVIDADLSMGGRLSDLISSLAVRQVARLEENIKRRDSIAQCYLSASTMKPITNSGRVVWFRYLLDLGTEAVIESFMKEADAQGIIVRRPIMPQPLHRYLDEFNNSCPVTDQLWAELVSIPIYPDLSEDETKRVACFLEAWKH